MDSTLQKAIDYMQKIEGEFLLVERFQQTKFDSLMSIDATARNDPLRQQGVTPITCYKCGKKVIIEMTALTQLVQAQYQIKIQNTVPLLL